MIDYSTAVYLGSIMMGFGHVVSTAERLSLWKIVLLLFVLIPFISVFNKDESHLYTMLGAFGAGFILPKLRFQGVSFNPSYLLANFRYRRQQKQAQRQAKKSEKEQSTENKQRDKQQRYEQTQQQRQREAEQFRKSQNNTHQSQSSQHEKIDKEQYQQEKQSEQETGSVDERIRQIIRAGYLATLGLASDGLYSQEDIKKAYRKQANNYHPDRHQGKDEETIQAMSDKFAEVKKAYEWLRENGN